MQWFLPLWKSRLPLLEKGGHGSINLYDALEQSCDVYFYQVGNLVGIDALAYYSKLLGLGAPTGVVLRNESSGLVPTQTWKKQVLNAPWHKGETLSCAVGQGFYSVTPVQMLVLISAIANGGEICTPLLIKKMEDSRGQETKKTPDSPFRVPVSPETIAVVRESLRRVVQGLHGTGKTARIPGVEVAGKTGTAQVISLPPGDQKTALPAHLQDHAWFFAFAPFDHPKIAVVVLVEHGGFGSVAAAPIARDVMSYYLKSLG